MYNFTTLHWVLCRTFHAVLQLEVTELVVILAHVLLHHLGVVGQDTVRVL